MLSWSPVEEALAVVGSRRGAIETLWRMLPKELRTPAHRKLVIAVVDVMRERRERGGATTDGALDVIAAAASEQPAPCRAELCRLIGHAGCAADPAPKRDGS